MNEFYWILVNIANWWIKYSKVDWSHTLNHMISPYGFPNSILKLISFILPVAFLARSKSLRKMHLKFGLRKETLHKKWSFL